MPSPFPGMDPCIEAQRWSGFHQRFITALGDLLVAILRPRYEVEPEERIYVESSAPEPESFRADVAVAVGESLDALAATSAADLDLEPMTYTLPMPVEEREPYLVIRARGSREVVSVIELLSPTNKRAGSDGRTEYLSKRREILRTRAHLVELDLLLGGQRLPTDRPLKATTDYCAFVCRGGRRPKADVFEWSIRDRLPRIPIPLANGDPDAIVDLQVDLQAVFDLVYERAGYDYSLQYDQPLKLIPTVQEWVQQVLAARRSG